MAVTHELERKWKVEVIAYILSILPAFFRYSEKWWMANNIRLEGMQCEIQTRFLSNTSRKGCAPPPSDEISVSVEFPGNKPHRVSLTTSVLRAAFTGALNGPAAGLLLALDHLASDVRRAAYTPLTHRGSRDDVIFFVQNVVRNTHCES